MKERRVLSILAIGVFISLYFGACASMQLTPERTVLWAADIYAYHCMLYIDQVVLEEYTAEEKQRLKDDPSLLTPEMVNPNLTEERKEVLRVKKEILKRMDDPVALGLEYVETGQVPPDDLQELLINLVNELIAED